jgi:tRNA-2-methylthio-N6-dimethylallyladenosine synthase
MDLLNKVRFHSSFSFKYSDRPHTRSANLADKIPEDVKSRRLSAFQSRQDQVCLERNSEYIDRKFEIMVESINGDALKGRMSTNHIVHCSCSGEIFTPGDLVTAHIDHAGKHSLKGTLQPKS